MSAALEACSFFRKPYYHSLLSCMYNTVALDSYYPTDYSIYPYSLNHRPIAVVCSVSLCKRGLEMDLTSLQPLVDPPNYPVIP